MYKIPSLEGGKDLLIIMNQDVQILVDGLNRSCYFQRIWLSKHSISLYIYLSYNFRKTHLVILIYCFLSLVIPIIQCHFLNDSCFLSDISYFHKCALVMNFIIHNSVLLKFGYLMN